MATATTISTSYTAPSSTGASETPFTTFSFVSGDPTGTAALPSSPTIPLTLSDSPPYFTNPPNPNPPENDRRDGGLVQSYFVFIAVAVILFFIFVFFFHKRRRTERDRARNRAQRALERDLDSYRGRSWPGPTWFGRRDTGAVTRHDDGLDERGEAPPAYTPAVDYTPPSVFTTNRGATLAGQNGRVDADDWAHGDGGLEIPLRTYAVERGIKPPDYEEHVTPVSPGHDNRAHEGDHDGSRPSASSRPEGRRPNS